MRKYRIGSPNLAKQANRNPSSSKRIAAARPTIVVIRYTNAASVAPGYKTGFPTLKTQRNKVHSAAKPKGNKPPFDWSISCFPTAVRR
ncbi:unnamed protein product [Protopolystoma xenopodis]|uniref:Uncharacterized protein n=1 Tax=Protopolystoma xenopodis TaxID=117903 RepID=A0A448WK86_9PLAT|nr:unnamed protein product [Protopolystoma xenopodis]